jgi:phosphoglycerate dehydrogenase-like enzyme/predicted dehydrogenase
MTPIRVAVIGAGPATIDLHLPVLARLRDRGEILLIQICDLQPARAASAKKRFGFQEAAGNAGALLARTDIDAVYIFGSAQMHHSLGLAVLENGKHLFVEKPIAPSYAEAHEIAETAQRAGLVAVGGHNRRFYKSFALLRQHAGSAGWRYGEAIFHKAEFGRPAGFGAKSWLTANGIHALDALIDAMGSLPEQISAAAGDGVEANLFSAMMRWRNGAQAVFLCDNNSGARREEYAFHGPAMTCRIMEDGFSMEMNGKTTKTSLAMNGDGLEAEHAAFLEAIRNGSHPRHAIAALAPSLFVAELIEGGFHGRVRLPDTAPAYERREPEQSVLVVEAVPLLPVLAKLLPRYRLVSPADIGDTPRPDIVAAIIGGGARPIPGPLLDRMPNLKIVGIMGLSLSRYEPEALLKRGIRLVNASAAYAESVAEFALGLAILGRRRAFVSHQTMRLGGWGAEVRPGGAKGWLRRTARSLRPSLKKIGLEAMSLQAWRKAGVLVAAPNAGKSRDLKGAHVGLIGWGVNAQAFTKRLLAMGAHVSVFSKYAGAEEIHAAGARQVSLAEALAADIVSLHRGLTPDTHHTLRAPELARLRSGTVLINVARGALIEPEALVARLKQGDIFACLDTFEIEPPIRSDPLRSLDNVFLTSHIAGGSQDMHAEAANEVVDKVVAYLNNGTVKFHESQWVVAAV